MESEFSVQVQHQQGICMSMCPEHEVILRERERLLHPFEKSKDGFIPPSKGMKCAHKADPKRMVKMFSRPAAGRTDVNLSELRPAPVLAETVKYLIKEIIPMTGTRWSYIYDFVFDRLRAVRQDLVIQAITGRDAIQILEQIVRFHTYASYRLRDCDAADFDPVINKQHMLECLKRLLFLYQVTGGFHENQIEFESIYLLDSLGDFQAMSHFLELPNVLRKSPMLKACFDVNEAFTMKNYARALHLISALPNFNVMCLCAVNPHLFNLRINYLQILCHGYSAKNCKFPVSKLSQLLHAASDRETFQLCTISNLIDMFDQQSEDFICFNKSNFQRPSKEEPSSVFLPLESILSKPDFDLPGLLLGSETPTLLNRSESAEHFSRKDNEEQFLERIAKLCVNCGEKCEHRGKGTDNRADYHTSMKGVRTDSRSKSGKGRGRGRKTMHTVESTPNKGNSSDYNSDTIYSKAYLKATRLDFQEKENDLSLTMNVTNTTAYSECVHNEQESSVSAHTFTSDSKDVTEQSTISDKGSGRGRGRRNKRKV